MIDLREEAEIEETNVLRNEAGALGDSSSAAAADAEARRRPDANAKHTDQHLFWKHARQRIVVSDPFVQLLY